MLPLLPGRAQSHSFEYKRNGTLSLFAALNAATGEVLGKTAARHTSEQFVAFLCDIVASEPAQREIRVICDNVSSHKTQRVRDFLGEHANVHRYYTPIYSSWLNQLEKLVLENSARFHQPPSLHFGEEFEPKVDTLHP